MIPLMFYRIWFFTDIWTRWWVFSRMNSFMSRQVWLLVETGVTVLTLKWFFPSMNSHMLYKVGIFVETWVAFLALEKFFSCLNSAMHGISRLKLRRKIRRSLDIQTVFLFSLFVRFVNFNFLQVESHSWHRNSFLRIGCVLIVMWIENFWRKKNM